MRGGCLKEARSHGALVFFFCFLFFCFLFFFCCCFFLFFLFFLFVFLALVGTLFSRAGRFEQFGRGSPKEHSCEIIEKSVEQFQRSLLKQKLQFMHVNFYGKSAPLTAFEGLMNRWMNE